MQLGFQNDLLSHHLNFFVKFSIGHSLACQKWCLHCRRARNSALMAVEVVETSLSDNGKTFILSDEQIEHLLKEAEERLRVKSGLQPLNDEADVLSLDTGDEQKRAKTFHLPKLEHKLDGSSYLTNHNGITRSNANLMVPAEQQIMADGLRSIGKDQEHKKAVRTSPSPLRVINVRKFYPKFFLMHISTSFWRCRASMRV